MDDLISRKDLMKKIAHHTVHDSMSYVTFERSTVYEMVKGDMFGLVKDAPAVASMPRWISVEEKLPEAHADGSVDAELVTDGEFIHMAYYAHGQWIFCESGEMKEPMWNTVTHWMHLPEPPKEDSAC